MWQVQLYFLPVGHSGMSRTTGFCNPDHIYWRVSKVYSWQCPGAGWSNSSWIHLWSLVILVEAIQRVQPWENADTGSLHKMKLLRLEPIYPTDKEKHVYTGFQGFDNIFQVHCRNLQIRIYKIREYIFVSRFFECHHQNFHWTSHCQCIEPGIRVLCNENNIWCIQSFRTLHKGICFLCRLQM